MTRINDKLLYKKLILKTAESKFKDSIERGEITKELAVYLVDKYCTFDVQPVIQVDDSDNREIALEVTVNFDKLYECLGLRVNNDY